ncbi:amidohydrolase family protein [Paenibacillus sp. IHBB 3054]|uniref:amidohydrolase family protein n=1 Tax=Paenibacillus sp. IHBB 3054 TaxID=3425689 RepID=UPI003F663FFF
MMRRNVVWLLGTIIVLGALAGLYLRNEQAKDIADPVLEQTIQSSMPNTAEPAAAEASIAHDQADNPLTDLVAKYKDLGLIDAHNHDASLMKYMIMLKTWKVHGVQQVVLFGDVSEPSAVISDKFAWMAYQEHPETIIPYFCGFDLHRVESLTVVRNNLEQGYMGIGEIVAASTMSPVVSRVAWKANHPLDGYLPQIYDLAAEYKVPVLLHIDPPSGMPVEKLEQALEEHPDTMMIFAHMNAYNTPEEIERLLSVHPNLYADFFAGFSVYNPTGGGAPEQFIPVMKKFPDRFMLSTDSGYGIAGEEQAIAAMYQMLELMEDPVLARKIAHDNLAALIEHQPATNTQREALRKLEQETGKDYHVETLLKVEAGKILAEAAKG